MARGVVGTVSLRLKFSVGLCTCTSGGGVSGGRGQRSGVILHVTPGSGLPMFRGGALGGGAGGSYVDFVVS